MQPVDSIIGALVVSSEELASIFEHSRTARMRTLPSPCAVRVRQSLCGDVSLAVKKVSAILARRRVIADDLKPSHVNGPDTAVCRVHHELAARRPLIHVTRNDLLRPNFGTPSGLSLGDPSADEDLKPLERGC